MSNKYTSLTTCILIENKGVTVSYNKEFMLPLMVFMPSLLGTLLYLYTFPALLTWVLIFFFFALLSGLIAHLSSFFRGDDVFLWKVDYAGFFFQSHRTNLFSLKPPVFHSWSRIKKVLYVKEYTTLDHELDRLTIRYVILLFKIGEDEPKTLEYPYRKRIGIELFNVMKELAPQSTSFEILEKYDDSRVSQT